MLHKFKEIYDEENYPCNLMEATEEQPEEQLLVYVGTDYKQREQILQITSQKQILGEERSGTPMNEYFRIQFKFLYPFSTDTLVLSQVASLLHFLNKQADFPGFELDELDNQVLFRYVWLVKDSGFDRLVAMSLTGIITLLVTMFGEAIERVATGKSTFDDLLREVTDTAKQFLKDES